VASITLGIAVAQKPLKLSKNYTNWISKKIFFRLKNAVKFRDRFQILSMDSQNQNIKYTFIWRILKSSFQFCSLF